MSFSVNVLGNINRLIRFMAKFRDDAFVSWKFFIEPVWKMWYYIQNDLNKIKLNKNDSNKTE